MNPKKLEFGKYYHIYNQGLEKCNIFREEKNYTYFLKRFKDIVSPYADTFAYCLMRNHFHLLVRIRTAEELSNDPFVNKNSKFDNLSSLKQQEVPSRIFSNFFNSYASAFNKMYGRSGGLLKRPFNRIWVDSEKYFTNLIHYIHFNPQKHGFTENFKEWNHSSYHRLISENEKSKGEYQVLDWFDGEAKFLEFHQEKVKERDIRHLIDNDDF